MKEFEIIDKYFKKLADNSKISKNLDDDVANITIDPDQQLIVSKDLMLEDVHFKMEYGGYKIAYKLLVSNLSDLASSGAKPLSYMLGFAKNDRVDEVFISSFCQALQDLSQKHNLSLIGGDTVTSDSKSSFSITIFGTNSKDKSLSRSGAKLDNLIFVSGNIGDSYIGLEIIKNKLNIQNQNVRDYFLNKHYYPTARIDLGRLLLDKNIANAAIDISDGLFADLTHICKSSNVGASIFLDKIPISLNAKKLNYNILDLASGGEDYELLFTTKKTDREVVKKIAQDLNLKITEIGYFSSDTPQTIKLLDKNNNQIRIKKYGYEH